MPSIMMKVSRASAVAIVAVLLGGGSIAAFNFNPLRIDVPLSITIGRSSTALPTQHTRCLSALNQLPCRSSKRCSSLRMGKSYDQDESSQKPWSDGESVHLSRRAALRQCSSIFAATAFASSAWSSRREAAYASEFSDGPEPPEESMPPIQQNAPPQFSDETVITPRRPVVQPQAESEPSVSATAMASSNPPSEAAQVTLENSQVVHIPVANPWDDDDAQPITQAKTKSTPAKPKRVESERTPEQRKRGMDGVAELSVTTLTLGAIGYAVIGRAGPSTDDVSAKPLAKVVMITPDPYGLDVGRRFYNGVDITINNPVPVSDVRKYCDAGKVKPDCTETISGFLGEVQSNSQKGLESPSMEQQETATAVLSYLQSLSSSARATTSPSPNSGNNDEATSNTAVAFSSYLNALSNGEISPPSSPQLVANYLASLNDVHSRMNTLESSISPILDEISGRLQEWQEGNDERLAKEFNKIEEHLMNIDGMNNCQVPEVDMNGAVNGVNVGELTAKNEMWG